MDALRTILHIGSLRNNLDVVLTVHQAPKQKLRWWSAHLST